MIIKKNNKNIIIPNPHKIFGMKCYICGQIAEHEHHIIYGRGKRKISDRERLTVALCSSCHYKVHNHHYHDKELKAMAQKVWLENNNNDTSKWYKMFYKFYG